MEKFIPTYLKLTEIINSNPNDAEAHYNRGLLIYTFECDFENSPFQDEDETEDEWDDITEEAALDDFEKAIELNPNLAKAFAMRGNLYLYKAFYWDEEEKFDLAMADFDKALSIDKNCKEAYLGQGDFYDKKQAYEKSAQLYSKAIAIDNNYIAAYRRRAVVYSLTDDQKCLFDYNKILELDPYDHYTYFNRGMWYFDERDYRNAISDFTKAIESNKDDDRSYYYYNRGQAYIEINEKQKAISDFRKTIAIEETEEDENPEFDYKTEAEKWIEKLL